MRDFLEKKKREKTRADMAAKRAVGNVARLGEGIDIYEKDVKALEAVYFTTYQKVCKKFHFSDDPRG